MTLSLSLFESSQVGIRPSILPAESVLSVRLVVAPAAGRPSALVVGVGLLVGVHASLDLRLHQQPGAADRSRPTLRGRCPRRRSAVLR